MNQVTVALLGQIRRDRHYVEMQSLDDQHKKPEYQASFMRDVTDTQGLRYTLVIDVYVSLRAGLTLQPHVGFNTEGGGTFHRLDEIFETITALEHRVTELWKEAGCPYESFHVFALN